MAATVGATLSGVTFPLRHAGMGPFKSSAGNVYFFGRDATNTGTIEPHKASDPMTAFTAQTAKTMSSGTTTAIEAASCYPVGDVIHVVTQISTGLVMYNSFNMATDAWTLTTSETAVAAAGFAPTANTTFVDFVVRSGGEVDVVYCAGLTAMSSGFNMVRYIRRTGVGTWAGATNVDNGGSVNWSGGVAILGASDRVHTFFSDLTNGRAYQRTLSAANALQTFPSHYDTTSTTVSTVYPAGSYSSGSLVVAAYRGSANVESIVRLTSADAPTPAIEGASNATAFTSTSLQGSIRATLDGSTVHLLYIDNATRHLLHDSDNGTATWGTDVDELTGAGNLNNITPNVYDRSGTKLAMVIDDNGTIKYAEIALAAATVEQVIHRSRSGYIYY